MTPLYDSGYDIPGIINASNVIDFLNTFPVSGPEGIWGFEPDEITLLILKDKTIPGQFGIYVIDTTDCRLQPGQRIGNLNETVEDRIYRLTLCSRWKKETPDTPLNGTATMDSDGDVMRIEGRSAGLSVTPNIILPNLLGLLRLRVRLNVNDPEKKIPSGLRKIYPPTHDLETSPFYL